MGTYSELATDSFLLNQAEAAKSIAIIGCAYCANQSLAYAKDMAIVGKLSLGGLRFAPYATAQEANRIKDLFENHGKTAKIKIFSLPHSPYCQQNQKDRNSVAKTCQNCDAIIALSCMAGCEGIRSSLPSSTKIIPGMATLGTIASYLTVERGNVIMNKEKTKVVLFKQTQTV